MTSVTGDKSMPKRSGEIQALGNAIRATRQERRFSQERFALHARIDRSYYGAIERGEINLSFETLSRVAHALDTTVGFICSRAGV